MGSFTSKDVTLLRCGKCVLIMFIALLLEISLNMLQRSSDIAHLEGGLCSNICMSLLIYLSISILMV